MTAIPKLHPSEVSAALAANRQLRLLDVRTPVEYAAAHVAEATLLPIDAASRAAVEAQFAGRPPGTTYVICKSGARAAKAAEKLAAEGLGDIAIVEGGTDGWIAAGLPVVRGRNAISLERQVRMAAGALNLVAALLALFVDYRFAGFSAFIGAGLLVAGITDWCGMGLLLAKMPWNK